MCSVAVACSYTSNVRRSCDQCPCQVYCTFSRSNAVNATPSQRRSGIAQHIPAHTNPHSNTCAQRTQDMQFKPDARENTQHISTHKICPVTPAIRLIRAEPEDASQHISAGRNGRYQVTTLRVYSSPSNEPPHHCATLGVAPGGPPTPKPHSRIAWASSSVSATASRYP